MSYGRLDNLIRMAPEKFSPPRIVAVRGEFDLTSYREKIAGIEWVDSATGEIKSGNEDEFLDEFLRPEHYHTRFVVIDGSLFFPLFFRTLLRHRQIFEAWNFPVVMTQKFHPRLIIAVRHHKPYYRRTMISFEALTGWRDSLDEFISLYGSSNNLSIITLLRALKGFHQYMHQLFAVNARLTLPETALQILRTCIPERVYFYPPHLWNDTHVRKAYRGGYTYCFEKVKNIEAYVYDVNGMYVSAFRDARLPQGQPVHYSTEKVLDTSYWIACGKLVGGQAPLPVYLGRNHHLIPPVNSLWIDSQERQFLEDVCNWKFIPESGWGWKKTVTLPALTELFQNYRNQFSKETPARALVKLLGNCCYGKLAMRPERREFCLAPSSEKIQEEGWKEALSEIYRIGSAESLAGDGAGREMLSPALLEDLPLFTRETLTQHYSQQLPLAIAITSYARCRLMNDIMNEVKTGNRVLYADTDCLHLAEPARVLALDNSRLGYYKLEDTGTYTYAAKKCYWGEDRVVAAGLPEVFRTREIMEANAPVEMTVTNSLLHAFTGPLQSKFTRRPHAAE